MGGRPVPPACLFPPRDEPRNGALGVSIRSSYTNTPLFTALRSPTICGLRASTAHFSNPLENAMPQISPNLHSVGGKIEMFSGPTFPCFYVFSRHPHQKQPWSHHHAFCGGPFHYPLFYAVSAAPSPEAALEPPLCILWGVLSRTLIQACSYEPLT